MRHSRYRLFPGHRAAAPLIFYGLATAAMTLVVAARAVFPLTTLARATSAIMPVTFTVVNLAS